MNGIFEYAHSSKQFQDKRITTLVVSSHVPRRLFNLILEFAEELPLHLAPFPVFEKFDIMLYFSENPKDERASCGTSGGSVGFRTRNSRISPTEHSSWNKLDFEII